VRRSVIIAIILYCFLSLSVPAHAYCTDANTPRLDVVPLDGTVAIGQALHGSYRVDNDIEAIPGANLLDTNGSLLLDGGNFTLVPNANGTARILFYAVTPDGCTATAVAAYQVLVPPAISDPTPPPGFVSMREGRARAFSAQVEHGASITWLLDGAVVARNKERFLYRPTFNAAGNHTLVLRAQDNHGLRTNATWHIAVTNVNRAPIQVTDFLDVALPLDEDFSINLSLYFVDPDDEPLSYTVNLTPPDPTIEAAKLDVSYTGDFVTLHATKKGKVFVTYTATDSKGAHATSDPANYLVINAAVRFSPVSYCGDGFCFIDESCETCEEDCGLCNEEECTPQWDCTAWMPCRYPGYQQRNCVVLNNCTTEEDGPPTTQECDYAPRCDDGVRNGNETGVDCGGSCVPCPTCDDDVQNGRETGMDCGGSCVPCPTCDDNIRNQDETDVDCGGSCEPCDLGKACRAPFDCLSKSCIGKRCQEASCADGIVNQDEEGIDCGGSCVPCTTCDDDVQNGRETGMDCGGPCIPCPTCDDNIRNQDERLVDCGGECRACGWNDYSPLALRYGGYALAALLTLCTLYLARSLATSQLLWFLHHGKGIHFFYEDASTYALIRTWNAMAKHVRIRKHKDLKEMIDHAVSDLHSLKGSVPDGALKAAITDRLRELYARMFSLSPSFELEMLVYTVRKSALPFTVKVIVLRNTKFLALLEVRKLYTSGLLALEDVLRAMKELRRAF